jgi:hypothetical protein
VGCLIKQPQRQGFAAIVADLLSGMIGLLIENATLIDRTVAGSDQRHQDCRAGAEPASNSPDWRFDFIRTDVPADAGQGTSVPLGGKRPRDAEAEIGAMIIGGVPEAQGRAEAYRIPRPGTAANDTAVTIALCYPG